MISAILALYVIIFVIGGILKLIIMIFTRKRRTLIVNACAILPLTLLYLTGNTTISNPIVILIASLGSYATFYLIDKKLFKINAKLPFGMSEEIVKSLEQTIRPTALLKITPSNKKFASYLPSFIQRFMTKREGLNHYKQKLSEYLTDNKLDFEEKESLEIIAKAYVLTQKDLEGIHKKAFFSVFEALSQNERITEEGKKDIDALEDYFKIYVKDFTNLQYNFTIYRTLDKLDHGELPSMKDDYGLNINLKNGEIFHWATKAGLMKHKRVTQRVSYGGFSSSVRIMKGLRYRAGSYRVASQSKEFLVVEDTGIFWVTNFRIGFKGQRKDFDIKYDKILSFDLTDEGLVIAKQGRENPYIFKLGYYEIPARIISMVLNK